MTSEDTDTERTAVRTYVPAYQKAEWGRHADRLGMSQSEFVRTMVQAGRRDLSIEGHVAEDAASGEADESDGGETEHAENPLRTRVLAVLDEGGHHSWDDLVDSLTADIEDRLDETLQALQSEGAIRYSGRHGGYAASEGDGGD